MIDDARAPGLTPAHVHQGGRRPGGRRLPRRRRQVGSSSADEPPDSAFDKIPELDGTLLLDDATRRGVRPGLRTDRERAAGRRAAARARSTTSPGCSASPAGTGSASSAEAPRTRRSASPSTRPASCSTSRRSTPSGRSPTAASPSTPAAVGTRCCRRRWRTDLMPPVLPDYIGQTVGGTLSVGGIGAMSFREGAQIDHVVALRAVTGNGGSSSARRAGTASCSRCCSPARARSA